MLTCDAAAWNEKLYHDLGFSVLSAEAQGQAARRSHISLVDHGLVISLPFVSRLL